MSSLKHNDEGFTGLEAAIVLIAFVVVAAVFSYVVLGAGFFTTQKAQQTVYSAVGQSSSTLEIVGNVYGTGTAGSGSVQFVNFSIGLAAGGTPVDMSKTVVVFSNATQLITLGAQGAKETTPWVTTAEPDLGNWSITSVQNPIVTSGTPGFSTLAPNEQFTISCYIPNGGIPANDKFNIEIRPSVGAAFSITRSVPGSVSAVNLLY
ncbi:MAG: archaellin/type IV pilin N-terminal domain-containing protein [Methanoregula sp.]|jgi:flagellin FlaB|uniref:archaellin/type IV pilin N-terminal domain-containing protein n=1 Tax=Methanoregula sp. TaxID=2052170 RepID=UPI003D13BADA